MRTTTRWMLMIGIAALTGAASPGNAQMSGIPLWNEPGGPGGLVLSGDVSLGSSERLTTSYAGRANIDVGALDFGAAIGVSDSAGAAKVTRYGATAALKLFDGGNSDATAALRALGAGIVPLAMNIQLGYAANGLEHADESRYTASVGLSFIPPIPGLKIEPWVSPGIRMTRKFADGEWSNSETRLGVAGGINATIGQVGIHVGADHESGGDTFYGAGIHMRLNSPLGGS